MKKLLGLFLIVVSTQVEAMTFSQAVESLAKHESVEILSYHSQATASAADSRGSWGDPHIKLAAKNFPKDSLKDDQTPMTGIELGIS